MRTAAQAFLLVMLAAALAAHAAPAAQAGRRLGAPALSSALAAFDSLPRTMAHPRLFAGHEDYAGIVAAAKAERARGVAALADYLRRHAALTVSPALIAQIGSADAAVRGASWWQQDRMLEGIAESAFVWYVTRDPWFLGEMRARMQLFGPKVLARNCSGDVAESRDYAWYFALGYDLAFDELTPAERKLVRDVVSSCARAGLAGTPATLRAHPDNGIAFNALGKFVGTMLILRGDMPEAAQWLGEALPAYVASLSPFGGNDGGFSNGSSYALWDAGESLLAWDLIDRVLGVPIYTKPWLANLPRFIAYNLPPGTPAGAFGDGAEVRRTEEWARFGKALAYRSRTALAQWYAAGLKGEDPARLHILLSPRARPGRSGLPKSAPDSAMFPSVGVAAMHSALDDPQRTSVLFRSSPFGSINHAHADQNSFVLYARGEVLAMDSGNYDSYNSPHWRAWYKQTRAHNAITFDGGRGQYPGPSGLGDRSHNGKIAGFSDRGAYVIAVGDASGAYGGDIRQARRTLVFARPSTLIVIDQLAAAGARSWEWNLHTSVPLDGGPDDFTAKVGKARLCGTVASDARLEPATVSGYSPPPSTPAAPHYWSTFAYAEPAAKGLFVSVLRAGCAGPPPRIEFGDGGNVTVRAAGQQLSVSAGGVKVLPQTRRRGRQASK